MMSLATIVGFIIAYLINSWMVRQGVKHGMMSQGMKMEHHEMAKPLSTSLKWGFGIGTYAIFIGVMYITSLFIPIHFA